MEDRHVPEARVKTPSERAAYPFSDPALTLPSIVYEYPAMDESSPRTTGRRASRHKAGS